MPKIIKRLIKEKIQELYGFWKADDNLEIGEDEWQKIQNIAKGNTTLDDNNIRKITNIVNIVQANAKTKEANAKTDISDLLNDIIAKKTYTILSYIRKEKYNWIREDSDIGNRSKTKIINSFKNKYQELLSKHNDQENKYPPSSYELGSALKHLYVVSLELKCGKYYEEAIEKLEKTVVDVSINNVAIKEADEEMKKFAYYQSSVDKNLESIPRSSSLNTLARKATGFKMSSEINSQIIKFDMDKVFLTEKRKENLKNIEACPEKKIFYYSLMNNIKTQLESSLKIEKNKKLKTAVEAIAVGVITAGVTVATAGGAALPVGVGVAGAVSRNITQNAITSLVVTDKDATGDKGNLQLLNNNYDFTLNRISRNLAIDYTYTEQNHLKYYYITPVLNKIKEMLSETDTSTVNNGLEDFKNKEWDKYKESVKKKKDIIQKQTWKEMVKNIFFGDNSKNIFQSIDNILTGKYINNKEKLKNKIESLLEEAKTSDKKIIKYLTTNIANKFIEIILNQSSSTMDELKIQNLSPEEKQSKFNDFIKNLIKDSNIELSPSPNQSRNTYILSGIELSPSPNQSRNTYILSGIELLPSPNQSRNTYILSGIELLPSPNQSRNTYILSDIELSPSPNQSRNTSINILSGECMTEPSLFISNQSYQEEGNSPLIENSPPSTLLSNPLVSIYSNKKKSSAPPRNSR